MSREQKEYVSSAVHCVFAEGPHPSIGVIGRCSMALRVKLSHQLMISMVGGLLIVSYADYLLV